MNRDVDNGADDNLQSLDIVWETKSFFFFR